LISASVMVRVMAGPSTLYSAGAGRRLRALDFYPVL
jgi:hypothetical protein